jgi:type IV pilus assembly protein PilO
MNFNLRNLRQRDIAIILIVLTVVAGVLWYFYMYQPSQDRIAELEADIVRLETEIQRGEDARRNLPDLRLAVALLEEERRVFLSQLPTESQVAR